MDKRTIFKMINSASTRYANMPYLSQKGDKGWERVTFSEAKTKVLTLASAFIELGIRYEDKIAILSEAKNNWIISELAMLYAGAISVPLSIKLLPEEITLRINHSDTSVFIISENTLEKVISQIKNYSNKNIKLIVLDKPSDKISKQCKQFDFDEKQLLYIDDLYELGQKKWIKILKRSSNLKMTSKKMMWLPYPILPEQLVIRKELC